MTVLNSQPQPNANVKGLNHTLHLYTSKVDKHTIQKAFLISTRNDEKAVYVTTDDPTPLIQEFNSTNVELKIIKPEEIKYLESEKNRKLRIIIDAGSIPSQKDAEVEERESYLNELSKKHPINCLCTYDVTKLNPKTIKQLAMHHNQLRLTTSDLTILSGDLLDRSKLSDDSIEKMVKDNLETIILALLQKKPMCGTDIMGTIHLEFNVLLSPGTIYPLLQSLKEKGLLTSKKHGKAKTYAPAEDAELKIRSMINEHIQARKLLNHYLQQEATIRKVS
ncbi:MAG: Transcriptional regulator PadR-like family protein [Candidatus Bathyarchaeota archaeon BA2]|nr:MAG: Transcriptional regulator PadR-like family protein [Candidatus Bathyarchaeota archaeon BA2]